ncbi:unnamed protein product [Brassica oleracea]
MDNGCRVFCGSHQKAILYKTMISCLQLKPSLLH